MGGLDEPGFFLRGSYFALTLAGNVLSRLNKEVCMYKRENDGDRLTGRPKAIRHLTKFRSAKRTRRHFRRPPRA